MNTSTAATATTVALEPLALKPCLSSLSNSEDAVSRETDAKRTLLPSFWSGADASFHDFLKEMGKFPLLREKEEATARLARQYYDFLAAMQIARTELQQNSATKPSEICCWS
jgi:hypothetical protein